MVARMDQDKGFIMHQPWNKEDDIIQLQLASNRAKREGDVLQHQQLQSRIQVLNDAQWQRLVIALPELAPYVSFVEGLKATAVKLGISFPNMADPQNNTGDGQFSFVITNTQRTVQLFLRESRACYFIEVFDYQDNPAGSCYQGQTPSLEEATIVISRWFVDRCSIAVLHAQFPWMAREPLHLTGPRMTFD